MKIINGLAWINPSALPALRIAGGLFLIIHVFAGIWIWRNWQRLFGPNPNIDGDRVAVRGLQLLVITIPWLFLTFRLLVEWVGLWR
jgi:hypothetical protein